MEISTPESLEKDAEIAEVIYDVAQEDAAEEVWVESIAEDVATARVSLGVFVADDASCRSESMMFCWTSAS